MVKMHPKKLVKFSYLTDLSVVTHCTDKWNYSILRYSIGKSMVIYGAVQKHKQEKQVYLCTIFSRLDAFVEIFNEKKKKKLRCSQTLKIKGEAKRRYFSSLFSLACLCLLA